MARQRKPLTLTGLQGTMQEFRKMALKYDSIQFASKDQKVYI